MLTLFASQSRNVELLKSCSLFSRFEAERLYVIFAAEISRTPVIPTRINLAIWNFGFEYKFFFQIGSWVPPFG